MSSRQTGAAKTTVNHQPGGAVPPRRDSAFRIGSAPLGLQQTVGNQAVSHMLGAQRVQTKLRMAPPDDAFEQEADRVAKSVVSMSRAGMTEEAGARHVAPAGGIQRKCAKCEEEEDETLRRSPADGADTATESAPEQEAALPTTETELESPATEQEPTPEEQAPAEAATEEKVAATLLVKDEAEQVGPGQMRKSEFLAALRDTVCATANEAMASTGQTTANCPWIDYWFDQALQKDAAYVEKALRKYAPETADAGSAQEFIPLVAARVRRSVEVWVTTGEITGVPEGVSADVPGAQAPEGGGQQTGGGAMQFKARPGGPHRVSDPQAIRNQLGPGRSLPGGVRLRMESAFGLNFSQVRIHNDASAGALSDQLNARAFTVGEHVAFGPGEYQPGSLVGDALLAHELAHVVQQGGATAAGPMMKGSGEYNALEQDADRSAVGAVLSLHRNTRQGLTNLLCNSVPRLRSRLGLQRCSKSKKEPAPGSKETPAAPTAPSVPAVSCPKETITMSGAKCGAEYGAVAQYCYEGAANWWFKEHVENAPGPLCQPGEIKQTTNPIQSPDGCVADDIADRNGPPSNVAPCTDKTLQTVFAGPTKAQVEQCKYDHEQLIEVTAAPDSKSGKVKTTTGGVSTDCNWTA
jgi:Domain of unknown function (DUF4157)